MSVGYVHPFMSLLFTFVSVMSQYPPSYHLEHTPRKPLQDKTNLLALEAVSRWDVSDWSSLDSILANCPLGIIPQTIPNLRESTGEFFTMTSYCDACDT
jgi:hypothetical protein